MNTSSQTDLVQWAGVVSDQLALTPPPDDTSVMVGVTNYTGNEATQILDGLVFSLDIRTQDGTYVDRFIRRIFGTTPPEPGRFGSTDGAREVTTWSDGNVRVWWTRNVPAEVSA